MFFEISQTLINVDLIYILLFILLYHISTQGCVAHSFIKLSSSNPEPLWE